MSPIAANIKSSEYMMYGTDFFLKADTQLISNSLIFYGTQNFISSFKTAA
jgi:hypothetical protein